MRVLVLNCGSSSIKYQLLDPGSGQRHAAGVVELVGEDHGATSDGLAVVVEAIGPAAVDAVGHRIVHGGETFTDPTVVDDDVVVALRSLVPLAPLHNPAGIAGIEVARRAWPDVAHVAVFDTAFHRTLAPHVYRYAVPGEWYERHGVRRYGFHGTSHQYVSRRAAELLGTEAFDGIVAHLGNGASITAIAAGRSVETSMGLSPLEGLVMGTRSGDVDPAVAVHVAAATGRSVADVVGDLNRVSGLRGLCGESDMRRVGELVAAGDEAAVLAVEVFAHRIRKYVGAYLAVLGGRCDALVFTAGIGERSATVRAAVCAGLDGLGIVLDRQRNEGDGRDDRRISTDGSPIALLVVATDEELEIARETAVALRR